MLGVVHAVFTGLSVATLGWLGLILCLSKAFLKSCWRQHVSPALLGIIGALALIFLIETYLGVSARAYGTFDPPGRQPVLLEGPLIRTLGWLYSVRPKQYIEFALTAWSAGAVIYLLLHFRPRHLRGAAEHDEGTGWPELLKKLLESAGGIMLVLGSLVFANAVDLKATGLNSFAAMYENDKQQLGTNTAAIAELQRQLANLTDASDSLLREPTTGNVSSFMDATDALVDALWSLEQAKAKASHLDRVTYQPNENPLPNFTVTLPPSPRGDRGEPEISMRVLSEINKINTLQGQAEATQHRADELLSSRDDELFHLNQSIALALAKAQRLTPQEKVKILGALTRRLAALVARDGIGRATQEISDLVAQTQQEATSQRQANDSRRARVVSSPSSQPAANHDLPTNVLLPGTPSLKAFELFITYVENADGGRCGGMADGIGMVLQRHTDDLEMANENGNLRPNPGGAHYHVRLTENKAGEPLPGGGFWIDIPDGVIVHADQLARVCSAHADSKGCHAPPFNIIWTDNAYPTQEKSSLRPIVYCFWPTPLIQ